MKKAELKKWMFCLLVMAFSLGSALHVCAEEELKENSWRYKDGELISTLDAYDAVDVSEITHPEGTKWGIDVSHHQKEIDWEKVKSDGVDFVIIRCGYGVEGEDRYWFRNIAECERLGIPYGVYLYSHATTTELAKQEAERVLKMVEDCNLSYPIFYDMEDNSTKDADLTAIANTFCKTIQKAGYPVGIYSGKNWWNTYLSDPSLSKWYRWVAQWNTACDYLGDYTIWQYTSKGHVDGIEGNVDLNYQIGYPADHGGKYVGPYEDVARDQWYSAAVSYVYQHEIMDGLKETVFGPAEILTREQFVRALWSMEGKPEVKYQNKFPDVPEGEKYADAVMWASQNGIVNGYTDSGKFGPENSITREEISKMIQAYAKYKKYPAAAAADLSDYKDASNINEFAKESMSWAVKTRLIRGVTEDTLSPQGVTNRAECATILRRFLEPYRDVRRSEWYAENVLSAYYSGVMTGLNEICFGPNEVLARAQFAVILYRMEKEPETEYTEKFSDVGKDIWYTDAILWANEAKIVTGYTDTDLFGPSDKITREQMAVMMYRYALYKRYDVSKEADFTQFVDAESVDEFAKDAMQWAVGMEIITGKEEGTVLDPLGNATRAECAAIVMRFIEKYGM